MNYTTYILNRRLPQVEERLGAFPAVSVILLMVLGSFCSGRAEARGTNLSYGSDYQQAETYLSKKNWAEAAILLKKVVASQTAGNSASDAMAPVVNDLARALFFSGRREESINVLLRQAAKDPGSGRSALIQKAAVISRQFLTNGNFQTYQEGLNFLVARKYKQARERFEHALEQEKDNVEILIRVGECFLMEGDHDSAAEKLKTARKLNPGEPEIRLWLGRALYRRGEMTQSLEELRAAKNLLPASELAPVWLAEALAASGQRPQAIQILEKDVARQPFHLMALATLARLRLTQAPQAKLDPRVLWNARKELQLVLSRIDQYGSGHGTGFESDLGLDLRSPDTVREEANALLQKIDGKLSDTHA